MFDFLLKLLSMEKSVSEIYHSLNQEVSIMPRLTRQMDGRHNYNHVCMGKFLNVRMKTTSKYSVSSSFFNFDVFHNLHIHIL